MQEENEAGISPADERGHHAAAGDTIFALASGAGRAAIAVVRISGPATRAVLQGMCGRVPAPRRATLATFCAGPGGEPLDRGLALWFPAPYSFTGEDSGELHAHGGRAVVAGICQALERHDGVRPAEPGEFTRRAYLNGRMDLTAVEGLADLIDAETRAQRLQALRQLDGPLGRATEQWRKAVLCASALVESAIDFADEDDVQDLSLDQVRALLLPVATQIGDHLAGDRRCGIRLREGFTVVIAGPPNAGKSTLINALARRDVAIVSPIAGTTRDTIEVHLDLRGLPVTLIDTAGMRETDDVVEQAGVARAKRRAESADLVLWLTAADDADASNPPSFGATAAIRVRTKIDRPAPAGAAEDFDLSISVLHDIGMAALLERLCAAAAEALSGAENAIITRERHVVALQGAQDALARILQCSYAKNIELLAEDLRVAARQLGRLAGRIDVEEVLDEIFARFCIGK